LVLDLPPGTGDVQLALIENTPITSAIIVSTPQDIALIDVHKGLTMFEKTETPILGLVENMSVYHCPKCGHEEHIFGKEAVEDFKKTREVKLLANIPLHISIRKAGDEGAPIALNEDSSEGNAFRQLAKDVIASL
ncbi:MAG: hypothetical protein D3907_08510, partial [Candidatus Electrothrix sp. AUS3]|nr:hypothetical protein [Candidatus Electrothrix gigas]